MSDALLFHRPKSSKPSHPSSGSKWGALVGFALPLIWWLWPRTAPLPQRPSSQQRLELRGEGLAQGLKIYFRGELPPGWHAQFASDFKARLHELQIQGIESPYVSAEALLQGFQRPERAYLTAEGGAHQRLEKALEVLEESLEGLGYFCSVGLQKEVELEALAHLYTLVLKCPEAQLPSSFERFVASLDKAYQPSLSPFFALHRSAFRSREAAQVLLQPQAPSCSLGLYQDWKRELCELTQSIPWPQLQKAFMAYCSEWAKPLEARYAPLDSAYREGQGLIETVKAPTGGKRRGRSQALQSQAWNHAAQNLQKAYRPLESSLLPCVELQKKAQFLQLFLSTHHHPGGLERMLQAFLEVQGDEAVERELEDLESRAPGPKNNELRQLWSALKELRQSHRSWQMQMQTLGRGDLKGQWTQSLQWLWKLQHGPCLLMVLPGQSAPLCCRCRLQTLVLKTLLASALWESLPPRSDRNWASLEHEVTQSLLGVGMAKSWVEPRCQALSAWFKEATEWSAIQHPYLHLQELGSTPVASPLRVFEPWVTELRFEWALQKVLGARIGDEVTRAELQSSADFKQRIQSCLSPTEEQLWRWHPFLSRAAAAWVRSLKEAKKLRQLASLMEFEGEEVVSSLWSFDWTQGPLPLTLTWPSFQAYHLYRQRLAQTLKLARELQSPTLELEKISQKFKLEWQKLLASKAELERWKWFPLQPSEEEKASLERLGKLQAQASMNRQSPKEEQGR